MDKAPNLPLIALSATVKVLAGEFGDPYVALARTVIEVGDIFLEFWEADVVPMDADDGGLDVDEGEPLLDPSEAGGCRSGRGGADDGVALGGEGGNVCVPQPGAMPDVHP